MSLPTTAPPSRCHDCPIALGTSHADLLLTRALSAELEEYSHLRRYLPGTGIVRQGEPMEGWHIVREGAARITILDERGHEQTLRYAYPGQLVGGCAHGQVRTYCYSAEAAEPTTTCFFPASLQQELFRRHPEIAEAVIGLLIADLSNAYKRLHDISTATAHERLPQVLTEIADGQRQGRSPSGVEARPGPSPGSYYIVLPRQHLADMLGVTKETAVRALTALKKKGLVETHGRTIFVADAEALRRLGRDTA